MKFPESWLRQHVNTTATREELAATLTAIGLEVEEMIVLGDALPRGEVVKVRLVGVLNLQEGDEFDAKILAVRKGSPEDGATDLDDLNQRFGGVIDTVKEWFTNYKGPDGGITIKDVGNAASAMEILTVSAEAFASQ